MTDRDNLLHARLMTVRSDIGDKLVVLLDACIGGPIAASTMTERKTRQIEAAIADALIVCAELLEFGAEISGSVRSGTPRPA